MVFLRLTVHCTSKGFCQSTDNVLCYQDFTAYDNLSTDYYSSQIALLYMVLGGQRIVCREYLDSRSNNYVQPIALTTLGR